MSLAPYLPWNWVKLDPARTQAARAHFDVTGKYDQWHDYCRGKFKRKISSAANVLADKGVEVVHLLSASEASDAKTLLLAKTAPPAASRRGIDYADVLKFEESRFLLPIVEKMLNSEIDMKITAIFGSEYFVHSLVANRTMPAKESKRSFLWHGDRGPRDFLKINMFLDATAEHGGTTEFLDLESSKGFEDAGYTFGANSRRVSDIEPIARKFGVSVNVIHPQLAAGEAFIFFPSRSLHRGYLPTRGIRHMLSMVLLPSPIHWKKAWETTSKTGYHLKTNATFPDTAEDLFAELGLNHEALSKAA